LTLWCALGLLVRGAIQVPQLKASTGNFTIASTVGWGVVVWYALNLVVIRPNSTDKHIDSKRQCSE